MRRLVNEPGPAPTAIAVSAVRATPAWASACSHSSSTRSVRTSGSPPITASGAPASVTTAADAVRVEVSIARIALIGTRTASCRCAAPAR
jgi:hypothetical protein